MSTEGWAQCDEALLDEILDSAMFIGPPEIKKVWGKLGNELERRGYSTAHIDMPSIEVFVLSFDGFVALMKTLKGKNPRWQENNMLEYGRTLAVEESAAFLARAGVKYVICISRIALVCSKQDPLGHEILHVWEEKLHLGIGALTKEFGSFLQNLHAQYQPLEQEKSGGG